MDAKDKKWTIKDVGRLAGVSKGTVDRVVHNRGEVSQESRRRVLEVIEKIGYRPNIYASLLASRRSYLIACLLPSFRPGEFWELVQNGIDRARREEGHYNVSIEVFLYDQFDTDSYRRTCAGLLARSPNAVIMAPMYADTAGEFADELTRREVPFVMIDSKLEDKPYLAYFGMPMYQSGWLGASLLLDGREEETVGVLSIAHPDRRDNPTGQRSRGFMDYIAAHKPRVKVCELQIRPYDPMYNAGVMDAFFAAHPEVCSMIMFNSRVHLIADYFRYRGRPGCNLLGYDMLESNREALRAGYCKYLITNRTEMQVYQGIRALLEYLTFRNSPPVRDAYSSIDILTRDNVDYYFNN